MAISARIASALRPICEPDEARVRDAARERSFGGGMKSSFGPHSRREATRRRSDVDRGPVAAASKRSRDSPGRSAGEGERSGDKGSVTAWAARDVATGEQAEAFAPRDDLGRAAGAGAEDGARFREPFSAPIQPDVADLVKAAGQDVVNEAAQEGDGIDGRRRASLRAEGHGGVADGDEAVAGEANTMRVAPEVIEDVLALREGRLGVEVPRNLRDGSREAREGFRILEVREAVEVAATVSAPKNGEHLGAKNDAHRLDGEEEGALRRGPRRAVRGDAAAGHDGVDMRMEFELARPGMQNERRANGRGQARSSERSEGPRGDAKERIEDAPTSERRERAKLGGEREDDVKVRHIEHARSLRLDPFLLGQRLTLRAMPVAARVVGGVLVTAGRALIDMPAEGGGSTRLDVNEDAPLAMAERRRRFEPLAVGTNNVCEVEALSGCPLGSHASGALRKELEGAWRFTNALPRHACITHRGVDARVAEELAHDMHVVPFIEQVGSKRVP